MTTGSVVGYAFVLGMIGLLNPCGFPLLPVYLAAFVGGRDRDRVTRALSGIRAGIAVTAGFFAVFATAGLLAGSVHAVLLAFAPWVMIGVGVIVVALGILGLLGRTVPLRVAPRFRTGTGFVAMAGFGMAYAIGSLSCSLPVFIAAIGGAFASGSAVVVGAVVAAYGLGMGLFATVLAVAVSLADTTVLRSLRPIMAMLPRAAGALCILIGVYLVGYWTAQLGGPDLVAPVTAILDAAQGILASMVESAWLPIGVALVVVILVALIVAARHRNRAEAESAGPHRRKESV
ncbi:cytochrome c biogenesis CcdA family protein [Microbacterium rhizosphaerae]|uniref:Cytochrome c biogenesis protein CcdA n=1 Tax=Microbacterium rhizosphaerae TaxID=1678237 RepID=A0ABZ0SQZ4_9MICO|nr:cytochrome c biogenesis protein CcdA [Microbacterium rhizosphaerae]WPR89647.1 cytochrome c biogenesis protein CcdA [Microbacterium rhizosphaerae]